MRGGCEVTFGANIARRAGQPRPSSGKPRMAATSRRRASPRRVLGLTCLNQGAEAMFHFGLDSGVAAAAWLAIATWHLGEVKRARQLAEQAVRSAAELGHVPSRAQAYFVKTVLETNCGDPAAALRSAETLLALAREHGVHNWIALGEVYAAWAR